MKLLTLKGWAFVCELLDLVQPTCWANECWRSERKAVTVLAGRSALRLRGDEFRVTPRRGDDRRWWRRKEGQVDLSRGASVMSR